MSYNRLSKSNRKEKQPNEASVLIRQAAFETVKKNPQMLVDKLWDSFINDGSVLAANMLLRLADLYLPPQQSAPNTGLLALLAKLGAEPEWKPEMETPAVQLATPSEAQPAPDSIKPDSINQESNTPEASPETNPEASSEATPDNNHPAVSAQPAQTAATQQPAAKQPAVTGPASEIGLAPAASAVQPEPETQIQPRPCRVLIGSAATNH